MGDPKKTKKKYSTPTHPWQKSRIEDEITLKRTYGLKNKKEIWKISSILKNVKNQVKRLNVMTGSQAEKETKQLKERLLSIGLINADTPLGAILSLETKEVMERRLQTILVRKSLARSMKQARQFITHGHIMVNGRIITVPSYLVKIKEENKIEFVPRSSLYDPNHPERYQEIPKDHEIKKEKTGKKEESEVASFDDVPEDEEELLKREIKKEKKATEEQVSEEKASKEKKEGEDEK